MRIVIVVLCLLYPLGTVAGEVYRWVDEDGNVHYSDAKRGDAEKVEIEEPQTMPAPDTSSRETGESAGDKAGENTEQAQQAGGKPDVAAYETVRISEPKSEATIWDNQGNVPFQVTLEPELSRDAGHRLAVYVDGKRRRTIPGTQDTLTGINRGQHELRVAVIDAQGEELGSSESVTFFVKQASLQRQQDNPRQGPSQPQSPGAPRMP